jgi:hypothetical protein
MSGETNFYLTGPFLCQLGNCLTDANHLPRLTVDVDQYTISFGAQGRVAQSVAALGHPRIGSVSARGSFALAKLGALERLAAKVVLLQQLSVTNQIRLSHS